MTSDNYNKHYERVAQLEPTDKQTHERQMKKIDRTSELKQAEDVFREILKKTKDPKILEIGPGVVPLSPEECSIRFDINAKILAQLGGVKVQGDFHDFKFPDNSFNIILWIDGPEHAFYPEKVMQHIKRMLMSGGFLLISCPNNYLVDDWQHVTNFNEASFKVLLSKFFKDFQIEVVDKRWLIGICQQEEVVLKQTYPRIMLCLMTKGDDAYLPRFLFALKSLTYPKDKLRLVWLCGSSEDKIEEFCKAYGGEYQILQDPWANLHPSYKAQLCNLFKEVYNEEDFVLFADSDLVQIPPDILEKLVSQDKDVIAPYIFTEGTSGFSDTYVFRYKGECFGALNSVPFLNKKGPIELDAVGTFLLIRGNVFRNVSWYNPTPHYQFCKAARKAGYKIWAMPSVVVKHANTYHEKRYSVEQEIARGNLPPEEGRRMTEDNWCISLKFLGDLGHIRHWEYLFLLKHINGMQGKLLDVGSGESNLPAYLTYCGFDVDGIDFIETFLLEVDKYKFHKMDAREMMFQDGTFDIVTCISTLEHIGFIPDSKISEEIDKDGDFKAIQEIKRVLKKGGKLILSVPFQCKIPIQPNERNYSEEGRIAKLIKGFKVLDRVCYTGNFGKWTKLEDDKRGDLTVLCLYLEKEE